MRAFSLLELLVAAALLGLLAGLGVLTLKTATHQAGSRALANTVASALAEARVGAIASGYPCAIAFPSRQGQTPISCGFYRLQGATAPALISSQNYTGDFPNVYIFNGIWPTDSSAFRNAGSVPQVNPVPPGSPWSNYQDITHWLPPGSGEDYCYVFRPDGSVVSNSLIAFDGAYHILVSSGLGSWSGPTSIPGSALLFTPTALGETFTISLSLDGSLQVDSGVTAATSAVALLDSGTSSSLSAAAPPVAGEAPSATPSLIALTLLSNEAGSGGPALPSVSVGLGGYVTLDVMAADTSSSGQRLYANWTVTAASDNGGQGISGYSVPLVQSPGRQAMDWDPAALNGAGAWHSVWAWRPPYDAVPGDQFTLTLIVQDSLAMHPTARVQRFVTVAPPGKILCTGSGISTSGFGLHTLNSDGTFPANQSVANYAPRPAGWTDPSLWWDDTFSACADGSRLAWRTCRLLPLPTWSTGLTDPTFSTIQFVPPPPQKMHIMQSISPAGDLVAYVEFDGQAAQGAGALYVQEVGGMGRRALIDPDVGFCAFTGTNQVDVFPGMVYRMWTDRITWDPTGGTNNEWTIYYSAFGSALHDSPLGNYNPTPQIRSCTVVADSSSGPHIQVGTVAGPVTSPNLDGAYAPCIPSYDTAPYEMTFVRWNGGVSNNKTVSVWDMSDPANPIYDQLLPPALYQSPMFVPKSTRAGQDKIVCAVDSNFVYAGAQQCLGLNANVNLSLFTPNNGKVAVSDFNQITSQGFLFQPVYTPLSW